MTTACAWCPPHRILRALRRFLRVPVSHGCCDACADRLLEGL